MPMQFHYTDSAKLPPLAWCLRLTAGSGRVEVIHGKGVELRPTYFVEGAWRGRFEEGRLDESEVLLGSGARITGEVLTVASTSHMLERLHSLHAGSQFFASNSLAFLLAVSGEECAELYPFYDLDLLSFLDGLSARPAIPLKSGRNVRLHYCCNVLVDSGLKLREERKRPFAERPTSFSEYREFLHRLTDEVVSNASSPGRAVRYTPLATVSSGYDSPACALLARGAGAGRSVTFATARSDFGGADDSGLRIGQHLGLEVLTFDRGDYLRRTDLPEVEFLAVGTGGEDVVMVTLEHVVRDSILFTGYLGDTVWGLSGDASRSKEYRGTYPGGASLAEFRLRAGFVHFPVPQTHHQLHPLLQALSRSGEMAPWRRGGTYERPIPRRLVEEAGVPGDWFGRGKKAITQPFYHGEPLAEVFSEGSYVAFRSFCSSRGLWSGRRSRTPLPPLKYAAELAGRVSWRLPYFRVPVWKALRRLNPTENAYTFHWAIDVMRRRYAQALP